MVIYYKRIYSSPIGELSLVTCDRGLVGAWFVGQTHFERGLKGEVLLADHPVLTLATDWLDRYFAGQQPDISEITSATVGTAFQQQVWAALVQIPYGQTTSYKALADQLNCRSAQAIGGAVGRNPLSIMVPCHRVLGADGSLTGYAGGLDKKIWLLEHEGVGRLE